jgi:hypothetical protein
MSNLSDAQRNRLPDSAFCGRGRTFPVLDQEDVHKAVSSMGRAADDAERAQIKACIMRKAKRFGWKLPAEWTQQ